ncbi:hypothetical protein ACN2AU_10630 [Aerococcus viridans]
MIYTIGYFVAFFGLLILLFDFKNIYSSLNTWSKFGFICLCIGLILPMIYGFFEGIFSGF